jgi:hypothetical protein
VSSVVSADVRVHRGKIDAQNATYGIRERARARAIFGVLVLRLQPEKLSETTRPELRVFDAEK